MNRIFAIPDIHGRKDLLDQLLTNLKASQNLDLTPGKDKLIFLGDMIDRGKDSKGVLDTVWDLTEDFPGQVIALAGNHEWLCIDGCTQQGSQDAWWLWLMNGGQPTLDSFPAGFVGEEYLKWMASLPLSHEEPGFFFSHAPVPRENHRLIYKKGQPFDKQDLTWTYSPDEFGVARNFKTDDKRDLVGVCGHIHALRQGIFEPRFYDHYIFADAGSGCHPKAPLVAIEVTTRKVIYAYPAEASKKS